MKASGHRPGHGSSVPARLRRRAFVAGGLAASLTGPWAQPTAVDKVWRIGYLSPGPRSPQFDLLTRRLRERGIVPAERLQLEARFADDRLEHLPQLAAELRRWGADIVIATRTPAAIAARDGLPGVPVVMASAADPVGSGLVQSLARPGGNVTGLSAIGPELASKSIELLRELRPGLRRMAALLQARDAFTPALQQSLESAGAALRVSVLTKRVSDVPAIEAALSDWAGQGIDTLFVQPTVAYKPTIELALRHRMASCSFVRDFALQGGLLAYSTNLAEGVERALDYVERLIRGARPADLPVQQIAIYDLVFNATTARALQIAPPAGFMARVTETVA